MNDRAEYHEYLNVRRSRTLEKGRLVTTTQPGFQFHAFECLVELCSFLAARYPCIFSVTRCSYDPENGDTWGDSIAGKESGKVQGVRNNMTGEEWDWATEREKEGEEWNPMRIAGCELLFLSSRRSS